MTSEQLAINLNIVIGCNYKFELMKINKNREEITLEETLAYLKYLNREKPFNKEEVVIPTKDYDELMLENRQKIPTPKEKTKKIKM
jgi:hypothetical protein